MDMKLTIEQTKNGFKVGGREFRMLSEALSYIRGYFMPCTSSQTSTQKSPAPSNSRNKRFDAQVQSLMNKIDPT